jgi:hypothetical protein
MFLPVSSLYVCGVRAKNCLALIIDNAFGFGSSIITGADGATTKLVKALAVLKVNTATAPNRREYNGFINFGFR